MPSQPMTVSRSSVLAALILLLPLTGCATYLVTAVKAGNTNIVNQLLAQGADVNEKSGKFGETALIVAAEKGHTDMVQALLAKGADVNAKQELGPSIGWTALMFATLNGHTAIVKTLIAKGADIDAVNPGGRTALEIAMLQRHTAVVEVFKRAALGPPVAETVGSAPAPAAPVIHSDVDTPGYTYTMKEHPDNFALVVGIEKYKSLRPAAEFAERDAAAVREHLLALGYPRRNIIYLAGQDATRAGIQQYLDEWLPRNVKPESTVFVYYSGHGAPDVNTKEGEAYLVPWDGNPSFLKTSAYPVKTLYAALTKLQAKETIVVMDACFSGAGGRSVLPKGAKPMVVTAGNPIQVSPGLTVLAAASGDEISGTLDSQGHGMFTYYFLKGLSGAAKNAAGVVTAKRLHDYLTPLVQDDANRQNRQQTPVLMGAQPEQVLARFE